MRPSSTRSFRILALLIVGSGLGPSPAPAAADPAGSLERLEIVRTEAALRADLDALREALARAEALAEEPRIVAEAPRAAAAHTAAAMAGYQMMIATMGSLPDAEQVIEKTRYHLQRAVELDSTQLDARLLTVMATAATLPPDRAVEATRQPLAELREAAPEDPRVDVADGFARLFAGGAREAFESALAAFRQSEPGERLDWWRVTTWGMLADVCLGSFADPADIDCADRAAARALELFPHNAYVLEIVAPRLARRQPSPAPAVARDAWRPIVEDPAGDGPRDDLHDASGLSWYDDTAAGVAWFRFGLHRFAPEAGGFGLNLLLDRDGDASNGGPWYGQNRSFRYDSVVSVYLRQHGDALVGVAGHATAQGFNTRRLADLPDTILFALEPSAPALLVGVPRELLAHEGGVRLLGAVGGPSAFNDDLPNEGAARVELDDRKH